MTAEDAFISFRYAENIAAGEGPVFNRGGSPVEGYSNPLWVGLLAVAKVAGFDVVSTGRYLGVFFGALVLLEIILFFGLVGRRSLGATAALVVATMPAFLFWSQAGLENSLYLWLLLLSLRLNLIEMREPSRAPWSAIVMFLLAVTRPEGIMFFVIFGIWRMIESRRENRGEAGRRLLLWAVFFIVPLGVFLLWRYHTFGMWLPNTFYAKVNNGVRWNLRIGALYLLKCMNNTLWIPLVVPSLSALIFRPRKNSEIGLLSRSILLIGLAQVAFVLYVGGDIHPYDRFCVLIYLVLVISAFLQMREAGGIRASAGSAAVAVILIAGNLLYSFSPSDRIAPAMSRPPSMLTANLAGLIAGRIAPIDVLRRFANPPPDIFDQVGRDLRGNPEIRGLLATDQCGKIPYWSGLSTVDLLGLNDPEIARIVHSTGVWGEYAAEILDIMPDTVIVVYRDEHLISRYYLENTLLSEPFLKRYELDAIYHGETRFHDVGGQEHAFSMELLRFRLMWAESRMPVSDDEMRWFGEHQPIIDTPNALAEMVEGFRRANNGDRERVIDIEALMN
jgi:hypothetical protein